MLVGVTCGCSIRMRAQNHASLNTPACVLDAHAALSAEGGVHAPVNIGKPYACAACVLPVVWNIAYRTVLPCTKVFTQ